MSNVENLLQQMSLRQPSEKLDQRVHQALAGATTKPASRRVSAWLVTLAASAACLLVGIVIGRQGQLEPDVGIAADAGPAAAGRSNDSNRNESAPRPSETVSVTDSSAAGESRSSTFERGNRTAVSDGGFFLLDGRPARRHRTFQTRRLRVYDDETGRFREVVIPIERDVVVASRGI